MLSILIFFPLFTIIFLMFISADKKKWLWFTGISFSLFHLLLFIYLVLKNQNLWEISVKEKFNWIPQLGIQYSLFMDGLSFILVFLTLLLSFLSLLFSPTDIKERIKEFLLWFFLLEIGITGVFLSEDLFLFFIFWEFMLIPMYFIIGIWGYENRRYATFKFVLFTMTGSVFLLLGIFVLVLYVKTHTGIFTFEMEKLQNISLPFSLQIFVFALFCIAFCIKVPLFPFHTWLPDAHTQAPTAGSILLAGVLLKIGVYGFLRIILPFFEQASVYFQKIFLFLSVTGIIYGAIMAWVQEDLKRLIAYSSISHMGFVILGIFTFSFSGLNGAIIQVFNHGVTIGSLFIIAGILFKRLNTRAIKEYGGLSEKIPIFSFVFGYSVLSSIGLPLLCNFTGEFLILNGVFSRSFILTLFSVSGIVLSAVYFLSAFRRVMFGESKNFRKDLKDLSLREITVFVPLVFFMLFLGIYPVLFLKIISLPVYEILKALL